MTQQYVGTKIVTAWPDRRHGRDGYAVEYEDGYASWSPADTFEKTYLELGNIDHLPGFQQRVIAEHKELESRGKALAAFIESDEFQKLDRMQQVLLSQQLGFMGGYLGALEERMNAFPLNGAQG